MKTHDSGYRRLFDHPHLIEALIKAFVPGLWRQGLDYSSMERVGESLVSKDHTKHRSDMIWRLRRRETQKDTGAGTWLYIYLLLEFQSRDEPFMAVRLLNYVALLYERLLKELKPKRGERLPLVYPLVLYNGKRPWRSPLQVADLIAAPPGLEGMCPQLSYQVIDERVLPPELLASLPDNPVAGIFRVEQSQDPRELPPLITALAASLRGDAHADLRQDLARWLLRIFVPEGMEIPQIKDLEEVKDMLADNFEAWKKDLFRQGETKGEKKGESRLLLRQLEHKFGALDTVTLRRIESADSERLLEWGERLLQSESLAEVFSTG